MKSWDIFCRVIDNYGDIGVCWRLARQLANEYPFKVRLWVDELAALKMIWPQAEIATQQTLEQVDIRHWSEDFPEEVIPADSVIEAFACDIPANYLQKMIAMKNAGHSPVWINLEYLSAEKWVEDCHLMQSVHPQSGLKKMFFFPGFTEKTGGLIREKTIPSLTKPDKKSGKSSLLISLFAYENAAIQSLIEAWTQGDRQIHCLVPQGRILNSINPLLEKPLTIGEPYINGFLTLEAIPFMNQLQYDQLLQKCDLNFVRGEDSLVRAIWAGKPFIWHIYQQEDDAHMVKLQAFLDLYIQHFPGELQKKLNDFWIGWNRQQPLFSAWQQINPDFDEWVNFNHQWADSKLTESDLCSGLVTLVKINE